jgi:hypothetical protein
MKFKCSQCNYHSDVKQHIIKHVNRKIKCSNEEAKIIELSANIYCEYCEKSITTKQNLIKHLIVCKVKKANLEKELEKEKEEVRILKEKLAVSEALNKKPTTVNNQFNIILTAYNNPDLRDIEKHLNASVKKIFMAVPTLVEKIHFNEEKPENHNLVVKNARTKLAKVFDGKKWTTMDEEKLLDELVDTYESLLIEYSNENGLNYFEKMNKIKTRDSSEKVYDDMRVEVRKVLYENRDMIKLK